jgi:hypothetical protein
MVEAKVKDVREALHHFSEQIVENMKKGSPNPHLNLSLDKLKNT